MPLGRYFVFVGGLLAALLFLVDWYTPTTVAEAASAAADRSIIRIHSAHKWPSAVVFDTAEPTIGPPPQPVLTEAATPNSTSRETPARQAVAMATDADTPATAPAAVPTPPKSVKHRTRVARPPAARVASYEPFGFRPLFQTGW